TSGAIAAAIGPGPCRPARLIDRRERRSRLLEHRGIGERNRGWHRFALGRKAERRWPRFAVALKAPRFAVALKANQRRIVGGANPATAVDEGIEHQVEELVGELEGDLLRTGRGFAGELVQGSGEIVTGKVEERHEGRRQRAAVVEKVVDRVADVELVD